MSWKTYKKFYFVGAAIVLLFPIYTKAITSTESLPKGVRVGAFIYGYADGLNSSFNSSGKLESLVAPLNTSITLSELTAKNDDLAELVSALNSLGSQNLGDQLLGANLYASATVSEKRYNFAFLYGVTDSFSLGLVVPLINRKVESRFSSNVQNRVEDIQARVGNIPQISEGLKELSDANINGAFLEKKIFSDNGYVVPSGYEAQALGDVDIESRFLYLKSERMGLALRGRLRLPTAKYEADIHNLLDRPLGDGNVSMRVGSLHDVRIFPGVLTFNSAVYATGNMPYKPTLAVRKSKEDLLPNLNDPYQIEKVSLQRAPRFDVDSGFTLDFWKGVLSLSMAYQYSQQGKNDIQGSRGLDYASLEKNTAFTSHGLEFTGELSSIPLFKKNVIPVPAKFTFTWFQPLNGRNTLYSPYGRFDVVMLF